jgi:hypothetical protein
VADPLASDPKAPLTAESEDPEDPADPLTPTADRPGVSFPDVIPFDIVIPRSLESTVSPGSSLAPVTSGVDAISVSANEDSVDWGRGEFGDMREREDIILPSRTAVVPCSRRSPLDGNSAVNSSDGGTNVILITFLGAVRPNMGIVDLTGLLNINQKAKACSESEMIKE